MKLKNLLAMCMAVCVMGVSLISGIALPVSAEEFMEDYYTYEIIDGGAVITNADTSISISDDVVIPDTLGGYPVTRIGDDAFEYCNNLTSIVIPDSVTSIGDDAFGWCESLTSIEIPDSVTSIGDSAFNECDSLTSIDVDSNNQYYTSIDGILYNKAKTELICCPEGTTLTSIEIPDSVTRIGRYAFEDCSSLTSIEIPDSVESIGSGAFYGTAYYNDESNWEDGVLYIGNRLIDAKGDISGEYKIKEGTKTIADSAFGYCDSLTSVVIGDSVEIVGDYAFSGCESLASVIIPDSVASIGERAFFDCHSLTSIEISDSVESIGDSAFGYCDSLTSINVDSNNQYYTSIDGILYNKAKTELICCPAGTTLTSVVIPDSVTSIGDSAFYGCDSLTSIEIGDSVTSIGDDAFRYCESLTSVVIGDSVENIGGFAFQGCNGLASIVIPDSVTNIGVCAFGYEDDYGRYVQMDGFTIYGYKGTAAETYATENGFTFIDMEALPQVSKGDINGDGLINSTDFMQVRRHFLGIYEIPTDKIAAADVNGDGLINSTDFMQIRRHFLGLYVIQ